MRVVGGTAKGRALISVPGDSTRPILDRVKTALFDILRPSISNASVLDLFGGTGSVGIEALSQGAAHCVFLDTNKNAIQTITENLNSTGFTNQAEVRHADAFGYLKRTSKSFDIIYVAPPQYKGMWIESIRMIAERPLLLKDGGMVIVQIDPNENEEVNLETLAMTDTRKYGGTLLLFFQTRTEPNKNI